MLFFIELGMVWVLHWVLRIATFHLSVKGFWAIETEVFMQMDWFTHMFAHQFLAESSAPYRTPWPTVHLMVLCFFWLYVAFDSVVATERHVSKNIRVRASHSDVLKRTQRFISPFFKRSILQVFKRCSSPRRQTSGVRLGVRLESSPTRVGTDRWPVTGLVWGRHLKWFTWSCKVNDTLWSPTTFLIYIYIIYNVYIYSIIKYRHYTGYI